MNRIEIYRTERKELFNFYIMNTQILKETVEHFDITCSDNIVDGRMIICCPICFGMASILLDVKMIDWVCEKKCNEIEKIISVESLFKLALDKDITYGFILEYLIELSEKDELRKTVLSYEGQENHTLPSGRFIGIKLKDYRKVSIS